jgi:hypothetical protein
MLSSDQHWDNPHCQRDKLKKHLDKALKLNAPVIIYGDFFCAMQGKWDKRGSKGDIRPEHSKGNYLDALVETAAKWLEPYKDIIAVIGPGNHETAILKHHETDLIERLVERLKAMGSKTVHKGGFSGYVTFNLTRYQTNRATLQLHYHHGSGGGGPVTRGVIGTNRRAVYLVDADAVATGHTHDSWAVPIARVKLECGKIKHSNQWHCSTPGYKEEYQDGDGGFHIERGRAPKPTGCAMWVISGGKEGDVSQEIRLML